MKSKTKTKIENFISQSKEETIAIATSFAKRLKAGDFIAFDGDLGTGKTTFIKGIAKGLGLRHEDEVKSPTFALMHIYPTRIPLYHFDLYRLDSEKEIESIGFSEFIHDPNVICCVEWAAKAKDLLPSSHYRIHFEMQKGAGRVIKISRSLK